MKKDTLEIIKGKAEFAKNIPTAVIEYNFEKLPRHKEVKNDSFFGVKARFNSDVNKDTAQVVYTM